VILLVLILMLNLSSQNASNMRLLKFHAVTERNITFPVLISHVVSC